jgi:hypothetical protein
MTSIYYPTKNLNILSTAGNHQVRAMEEERRTGGHREIQPWVPILQDSDDVVASTIVATADTDKPHRQTEVYIPYPREKGPMGGAPYNGPEMGTGRYSRYQCCSYTRKSAQVSYPCDLS